MRKGETKSGSSKVSTLLATMGSRSLNMPVSEEESLKVERKRNEALFKNISTEVPEYAYMAKDSTNMRRPCAYSGDILSNIGKRAMTESMGSERIISVGPIQDRTDGIRSSVTMNGTYTIQNKAGQWSRVGKVDSFLEKPITRKEILDLEKRFDSAIKHSKLTTVSVPSRRMNPVLERDVVDMRRDVEALYENCTAKCVSEIKLLTESVIAQKWTDLVFSEISASLGIGCTETGRLLAKIRKYYGQSYRHVRSVHIETLKHLVASEKEVASLREVSSALRDKLERADSEFQERMSESVRKVTESKDEEIAIQIDRNRELSDQNDTLKDTLSTLNGIFKGMRENADGLREANLREANARMQEILKSQAKELKRLKSVDERYARAKHKLEQQEKDIEDLKASLDERTNELEEQRDLAQELMKSQGERLAKMESMMSKVESGGENPKEAQQALEKMARETSAGIGGNDGNVLCVRCRKSMAEARQLDEFETTLGEKMKRLPCASYRILLPNLLGFEPKRELSWILQCCRAIAVAKLKDDSLRRHRGQLCVRMPEFVYTWFAPATVDGQIVGNARSRDESLAEADENRWGLYYGLKTWRKRLPEVQIFYELLDETHGEDDATFYLYNLQSLLSVGQNELRWGSAITRSWSYATMQEQAKEDAAKQNAEQKKKKKKKKKKEKEKEKSATTNEDDASEKDAGDKSRSLSKDIQWISQETAVQLVEIAMEKSTEADRDRIILRILQKALPARGRLLGMENYDPENEGRDSDAKRAVDVGIVLGLLMSEYRDEQVTRKASVRLMFKTAIAKKTSELLERANTSSKSEGGASKEQEDATQHSNSLDVQQFSAMLRTLNADVDVSEIARLYRQTFESGASPGVSVESFLACAEKSQFFSSSLRLPPFYGAATSNVPGKDSLTNAQCDELRDVVYSHFQLFRGILEEYARRLHPAAASHLERLVWHFHNEVNRATTGRGIIGVDGRRLLCSYRRILGFLRTQERQLLEEIGEDPGPFAVKRVAIDISHVESMLSRFVQKQKKTPSDELEAIVARIAASKICHRWKLRQESHPLTVEMRRVMSDAYARGSGAMVDVSRQRSLVRREHWMVCTVYDIVSELYSNYARDRMQHKIASMSETKEANMPSYGYRYEPPNLCKFVHDYFLRRYGSLALGELHLHDLFTTMRSRTEGKDGNGLAKIFYNLVTRGRVSETPEFGEDGAITFFLCAIAACHNAIANANDSADDVDGNASAVVSSPPSTLLPSYDSVERVSSISKAQGLQIIKALFPEARARSKLKKLMRSEAMGKKVKDQKDVDDDNDDDENDNDGDTNSSRRKKSGPKKVDFCKLMWLVMSMWKSEIRRRSADMRARLQSIDPSGGNDVRTYMRSFCTFSEVMHAAGIFTNQTDRFKVNLYQLAIRNLQNANRGESIMKQSASDAANALVLACRMNGLIQWDVSIPAPFLPSNVANSCQLVRFAWLQYSGPVAEVIKRLETDDESTSFAVQLIESAKDDVRNLHELMSALAESLRGKDPTSDAYATKKKAKDAWRIFTRLLENLRVCMKDSGMGSFVPDNHAIEKVGGYRSFFEKALV